MAKELKKRYTYWMEPSKENKIREAMSLSGTKKQSQFINEAVDFYVSYIFAEPSVDCLSPIINRSIKNVIAGSEKNICEMLFKLAVEVGVLQDAFTDCYTFTSEEIDEKRDKIARQVAETNGVIKFVGEDNS